jgi:iron complex transport system substrate-binding protein
MAGGHPPANFPMKRISLSPSTTEILSMEAAPELLVGRTASCNFPPSVVRLPVYATVKPDFEALKAASPDLVVLDAALYSSADISKLEQTVGKDKIFQFNAKTIDEFENELRVLGGILGSSLNMSKYIDKINHARSVGMGSAANPPAKVAVIAGTLIAGTKGFISDAIKASGGQTVGPDADRFVTINPEVLIQSDPDLVILAVDISGQKTDAEKTAAVSAARNKLLSDPRYRSIKAIKNRLVIGMDADILDRQGARVDVMINDLTQAIGSVAR